MLCIAYHGTHTWQNCSERNVRHEQRETRAAKHVYCQGNIWAMSDKTCKCPNTHISNEKDMLYHDSYVQSTPTMAILHLHCLLVLSSG